MLSNEFIVFDVIGTRYRLKKDVFKNYKSSLFYELADGKNTTESNLPAGIIRTDLDEYYVQRSPAVFKIVLLYCINGKLHVPSCVCSDEIEDEFIFWQVKYKELCSHCAVHHEPSDDCSASESEKPKKSQKISAILWETLENPHSSWFALVFFIASMLVIVLSILNLLLASIPELQFCPNNNTGIKNANSESDIDPEDDFEYTPCIGTKVFNIIDMFCMAWFTIELLLRFISCPSYKEFFTSALIIIDILSILPFYLELIMWLTDENEAGSLNKTRSILMMLRVFKVFRIFRVLKLVRYSLSLKILGKTIKAAKQELCMLLIFIIIALLIFSNCLYQMEKDEVDTKFSSIPATFWWCIVTFSTVGYGDVVPQTIFGKIIAGVACVCGLLLVAFPIAVLVEKFTAMYKEEKNEERKRRNKEKEMIRQQFLATRSHSPHTHHEEINVSKF